MVGDNTYFRIGSSTFYEEAVHSINRKVIKSLHAHDTCKLVSIILQA